METPWKEIFQKWSSILSLRPRTILISFGTISLSSDMPAEYKKSLVQAIKAFPDITFVWKYEVSYFKAFSGCNVND